MIVRLTLMSTINQKECSALPSLADCWLSAASAGLVIPESFQAPGWILQYRQQLYFRVSWMIVAQVQLSQVGGAGAQSCGQRSTAFLCDQTPWQPANTQNTHGRLSEDTTVLVKYKKKLSPNNTTSALGTSLWILGCIFSPVLCSG